MLKVESREERKEKRKIVAEIKSVIVIVYNRGNSNSDDNDNYAKMMIQTDRKRLILRLNINTLL